MSARGIGAFAEGLSEGFDKGQKQAIANQKEARDQELFGLQKAALERQEREAALEEQVKNETAEKIRSIREKTGGGFEGEVFDENGQSLGVKTIYGDQQYVNDMLASQGYSFKPESVKQVAAADPYQTKREIATALIDAAYRTKKIDLKTLDEQESMFKKWDQEGVFKALDYFRKTGDRDGMMKIFDGMGKEKSDQFKDIEFRVEKDELTGTPTVIGYRPGKDGKPMKVFDEFQDVVMASVSPDQRATLLNNNRNVALKEYGDTYRTERTIGSQERISNSKLKNETALKMREWERDDRKFIQSATTSDITSALRNPLDAADRSRTVLVEREIGATAEQLQRQFPEYRDNPSKALSDARAAVYKKYKIDTTSILDQKK